MAMSTASVTTDTTNYIRIHLILMKGGTLLTKTLFLKRVKDLSPAGHELTVDEFLGQHSVKILATSTGKNNEVKLYPMTGTTNLDEWDLPLYCFILKTVCDLPMKNKLDMGNLKTMRNELSHLHDPSLTDADFKNHLSTIEPIFTRSLQMINDPLFEKEMKTLLQKCETGALAVDEVVKVHHDSNRKHIELLSNQVKMMKNQVDMMKNQGVMLQNQTTQEGKIDSALSMLTEIKDRLPPNSDADIPDIHVIIEVKNCTKEKEKELLDFLVKQFNETISKPECSLNKDFPNLAMHKVSEAICKTFQTFLEKGRHIIKVENKCIYLTVKCNSISSFVSLVRDCMDGKLLDLLSDLKDAMQSWEGCTHVDIDPAVSSDEIIEAILKLARNLNEKFPKNDEPPQNFASSTMIDISTSKDDTTTSFPTSSVLRLTIKPENFDRRKEIEESFISGSVSDRFRQFQHQLREDPHFTNVEIEAKLLTSDMPSTGLMKTQQLEASISFENPHNTQGSDTERKASTVSLPEPQTLYETDDLTDSSSLYFKEERGLTQGFP